MTAAIRLSGVSKLFRKDDGRAPLVSIIRTAFGADQASPYRSALQNLSLTIEKGDRVGLVGFGSFSLVQRKARTGRNPQTGKEIKIPAKKVVKFKPGADLAL